MLQCLLLLQIMFLYNFGDSLFSYYKIVNGHIGTTYGCKCDVALSLGCKSEYFWLENKLSMILIFE